MTRTGGPCPAQLRRAERIGLVALWLGAAALRAVAWLRLGAISNDGPRYLEQAQALGRGDWVGVLSEAYHPLYAAAIWSVRSAVTLVVGDATGSSRWSPGASGSGGLALATAPAAVASPVSWDASWERAAVLVSIAAGATAVVLLVRLLREMFGAPLAWVGGTLLAVHSRAVEFSAEVQSDALYLAFFVLALWWGWRALRDRSPATAAALGAAAGVAYLARPEGLLVPTAAAAVVALLALLGHWPRRAALGWIASAGGATLLCVLPYVFALRAATGVWTLTQKKSITKFLAGGADRPLDRYLPDADGELRRVSVAPLAPAPPAPAAPRHARIAGAAAELLDTGLSGLRPVVLVLLGVGVVASIGRPGLRAIWSVAPLAVAVPLLFLLSLQVGYVSRRHTLPPLLPLFGYAAVGASTAGRAICAALRRAMRASWRKATRWGVSRAIEPCVGAALAVALIAPQHLQIERSSCVASRRAAEWLRHHAAPAAVADSLVAVESVRNGYYSGLPAVLIGGAPPEHLPGLLEERDIRYVIVDDARYAATLLADPHFRSLYAHRATGRTARVFGRTPSP